MYNYIHNNKRCIEYFQKLYEGGFSLNKLLQAFYTGKINDDFSAVDLARFRVFLDSCLLLHNRERIDKFFEWSTKREYSFVGYIQKARNDENLSYYLDYLKEHCPELLGGRGNLTSFQLVNSCSGQDLEPYQQVKNLRNNFAHMQLGNFIFNDEGWLIGFKLFDSDNKPHGWAIWPVVHDFIMRFFSNYFEVRFQDAFFSKYSDKRKRKAALLRFYVIKQAGTLAEPLDGFNGSPIKTLIDCRMQDQNLFFNYLNKNFEGFEVKEVDLVKEIGFIKAVLLAL